MSDHSPHRRTAPAGRTARRLAVLLALVAGVAQAAGPGARAASAASAAGDDPAVRLSAACRDDATRLCPDIAPGGGRVAACMRDKRTELSAACKRDLMKARAERRGGAPGRPASGAAGG